MDNRPKKKSSVRDSKVFDPATELFPNTTASQPNLTHSVNKSSNTRRKEDSKLDDVVMGKFTKKMISNWVGSNTQILGGG